jgi:hypothetical protein
MKAHQLLSEPEKWTQFAYARDKDGHPTQVTAPEATRFCMLGALRKCYPDFASELSALSKVRQSIKRLYHEDYAMPSAFNDTMPYEDVKRVLEDADA